MSEPKLPPNTCPLIDKVISIMDAAHTLADHSMDGDDIEDANKALCEIERELRGESDRMEVIRDANYELRKAVEYWKEEAERLQEMVDKIKEAVNE